jgi:hypothetical protein
MQEPVIVRLPWDTHRRFLNCYIYTLQRRRVNLYASYPRLMCKKESQVQRIEETESRDIYIYSTMWWSARVGGHDNTSQSSRCLHRKGRDAGGLEFF